MSNDSFKYTPDSPAPIVPPQKSAPNGAEKTQQKTTAGAEKPKNTVPWSPGAAVIYTLVVYFFAQLAGSMVVILFPRLLGWDKVTREHWLDTSVTAQFWFVLCTEAITFGA